MNYLEKRLSGNPIQLCDTFIAMTFMALIGFLPSQLLAATYQQGSDSNGLVVIEAEDYETNTAKGGHTWSSSYPTGYSGTMAMEVTPNSGNYHLTGYSSKSPRLDYKVNFLKSGVHYVWIRGYGASSSDDSLHIGLDGMELSTSSKISEFSTSSLSWSKYQMGGKVATIYVASAGEHTLNLWMREDGMVVDKILLSTSSSYRPSDDGPQASNSETPVGAQGSFPLDLYGSAPQQESISIQASKPSNAVNAVVKMNVYDADFSNEGELIINGNSAIKLFGGSSRTGDGNTGDVNISTPASYWKNGSNTLVFKHTSTGGYIVNSVSVSFENGKCN